MTSLSKLFGTSADGEAAIKATLGLSWDDFVTRLFEIDTVLIEEGVEPRNRPIHAIGHLSKAANTTIAIDRSHPVVAVVHQLYDLMYGRRNLVVGPIHVGALMIRDVFVLVEVPLIYGQVSIDLWKFVAGVNKVQLEAFYSLSSDEYLINTDQLIDIFDFAWAHMDEATGSSRWAELFGLAKEQIEGACQTLLGSFSKRVAVQGTAYAVELAGKALLIKLGATEDEVEKLRHNLPKIIERVCHTYPDADRARLKNAAKAIPYVIDERYNFSALSRLDIGNIVRNGQFILGEFGRLISDRDARQGMTPAEPRRFPAP